MPWIRFCLTAAPPAMGHARRARPVSHGDALPANAADRQLRPSWSASTCPPDLSKMGLTSGRGCCQIVPKNTLVYRAREAEDLTFDKTRPEGRGHHRG